MNRTLKTILVSAGLCSLPSLCFSAVVYDNPSSGAAPPQYVPSPPTLEFGDQIILTTNNTTDRILSQFQFEYFFSGSSVSAQTWTLRLYANDGITNSPGTVLFTGDPQPVSLGANGYNSPIISFNLSSNLVRLPNTFTWTVQFSNLGGQTGGLLVSGPPTVGDSFNDFWQKDAAGWSLMKIGGGALSDFAARVNAVPEPGVLALGGLGALLLAGLRWLRKSSG